jgi:hypothetical protein
VRATNNVSQRRQAGIFQARVKDDSEIILFNDRFRVFHANGWKRQGQSRIVVHGGRGVEPGLASIFNQLRHARRPDRIALMNKLG